MVSKLAIDFIPSNTFYGFDHLMLDLIIHKKEPKVKRFSGYWLDIGNPEDYKVAIDVFEKEKEKFLRNNK